MKKATIAALVGGIILFIWQSLSNTVLQLHADAEQYTPGQDSIINFLSSHLQEGRYILPGMPPGTTMEQREKLTNDAQGKPWAIISYHNAMDYDMGMSLIRTFLIDIIVVWLLCWFVLHFPVRKFATVFLAAVFLGLIVFLNSYYTNYIWYKEAGIMMDMADVLIGWALVGIWLGVRLKTKNA